MVQRESKAFELNVPGEQVRSSQARYVNPNVAKFAPGRAQPAQVDDSLSSVVGAISKGMQQAATTKLNNQLEMAYLDGAASAQAGEVEDMLETDPITKDWKVAGYRDTVAKLKMADIDSRLSIDMRKLQEQDPQKFQEYLRARREEIFPYMQGMSQDARKGLMAQRLTWERQAIAQHGAQHYGFILGRKQQALTNSMRIQADNLTKVRNETGGNPVMAGAYITGVDAVIGQLYKDVILDDMWSDAKRGDLIYEAAHGMLSSTNNHMLVYEKLRDTQVVMKDGTSASMLSLVPADKLDKLSTDFTQAKNNVEGVRMEQSNREMAFLEARINDELGTQFPSADELKTAVAARQTLDPKYNSGALWEQYAKASIKRERSGLAEQAYATGDKTRLRALGMDEADGLRATMSAWTQRGLDPAQQAERLLDMGMNQGMSTALGELGKRMSGTIANLGVPDRPVDAAAMTEVGNYLQVLEKNSQKGRRDLIAELTTNMPEDTARKVQHYIAKYASGGRTAQQAWEEANDVIVKMAGKTNAERAAMSMVTAQERTAMTADFQPLGWGGALWDGVASVFSKNAEANLAASPVLGPFVASDVQSAVMVNMRTQYADEIQRVANVDPALTGTSLDRQVKRNLAARSIPVASGALFLPPNTPISAYTGGRTDVDKGRLGRAIDELYPPGEKGGYVLWQTLASGTLTGVDYNSKGARTGLVRNVDTSAVASKLAEMDQREQATANAIYGDGRTYKSPKSGDKVNYNGRNNAAVRGSWMLQLRDDLVRLEGVQATPYKDTKGNVTAGVGIVSFNKEFYPADLKEDGRMTQAQIDESFRGASNNAALAATKAATAYRLQNDPQAFRLLGNMAYQGGPGSMKYPTVTNMLAYATSGQEQAAVNALKDTPQYMASGKERKTYYENLVRGISRR